MFLSVAFYTARTKYIYFLLASLLILNGNNLNKKILTLSSRKTMISCSVVSEVTHSLRSLMTSVQMLQVNSFLDLGAERARPSRQLRTTSFIICFLEKYIDNVDLLFCLCFQYLICKFNSVPVMYIILYFFAYLWKRTCLTFTNVEHLKFWIVANVLDF